MRQPCARSSRTSDVESARGSLDACVSLAAGFDWAPVPLPEPSSRGAPLHGIHTPPHHAVSTRRLSNASSDSDASESRTATLRGATRWQPPPATPGAALALLCQPGGDGAPLLRCSASAAAVSSLSFASTRSSGDTSADESPALRRSVSSVMDTFFAPAGVPAALQLRCSEPRRPLEPPRTPLHAAATCEVSPAAAAAAEDAVELCCRLSRARQTVEFLARQRARHCTLAKARLSLWDALMLLEDVPPVAAALAAAAPGAPPVRHLAASVTAAELARARHPGAPWLAFVALTHALGRLLLLPHFGGEPVWAIVGESFPVGCRFDPSVSYAACFGANPDRRKRAYASPCGIYAPGSGLAECDMCWSGDEYLLEVLARNTTHLPPAGLFCVRYGSFATLGGAAVGYNALMTQEERASLPWLAALRDIKRDAAAAAPALSEPVDGRAALLALAHVYRPLIDQFCPGELRW
jgi:inositol oxygenase